MMPMLTILVIEKKQFNFQLPDSKWLIRLFEKFNVTFIDRYILVVSYYVSRLKVLHLKIIDAKMLQNFQRCTNGRRKKFCGDFFGYVQLQYTNIIY